MDFLLRRLLVLQGPVGSPRKAKVRSGQGGPPESAGAAALPACRAGFGWLWLRLALPGFGFRLAFKISAGFRLDFGWILV